MGKEGPRGLIYKECVYELGESVRKRLFISGSKKGKRRENPINSVRDFHRKHCNKGTSVYGKKDSNRRDGGAVVGIKSKNPTPLQKTQRSLVLLKEKRKRKGSPEN